MPLCCNKWGLAPAAAAGAKPHRQHQHSCRHAAGIGNGAPEGGLSIDDDADSGLGRLRFNKREQELPQELQGLEISEDGFLIDTKTGKVINEFGATRFDVAVRALRGELDPPQWVDNSERNPGVLLGRLMSFPTSYTFQVVGKVTADSPKNQFVSDMVSIVAQVCEAEIKEADVTVQERLGGKFVSISMQVLVRAPEIVQLVYEAIGKDSRVKMKF
eukprot:gene4110-4356_t